VVGSGVGASTAAIVAHDNGDRVIALDKAPIPGGTSSKSAGVLWIPNNFTLRAKGIKDEREDCLRYIARYSYPEHFNASQPNLGLSAQAYALLEAFYDNASAAVDRLRDGGALNLAEWRMFALDRSATDYLDNVPENKVPAGRTLGALKADGTVGGGIDLMLQLGAAVSKRGIPLLLNHRAMRLVLDENGRAIGVEAEADGTVVTLRARKALIFATGGYVHNPEFIDAYQRNRLYGSCAMPWATGDFINIAGAAGARMGNLSGAWRTQIMLEEALHDRHLAGGVYFPPGDSALQVNRYGRRAVNENRNYNDRTEVHGIFDPTADEFPNHLMFMVYDQRSAEGFAGVYPLPEKPTDSPHVLHGATLEELAAQLAQRLQELAPRTGNVALAPDFTRNLKATIARYNGFARKGVDEDFGRGAAGYDREWFKVFSPLRTDTPWKPNPYPCANLHPLRDQGPYYALILAAGALDTNGGPMIDASARVLSTEGRPIPGLYGAGNCIASPSRFAYWGAGHTLAASLTFGYIAANAAHQEAPVGA
jgi:3-oxosteroid 1-dehydrogenase